MRRRNDPTAATLPPSNEPAKPEQPTLPSVPMEGRPSMVKPEHPLGQPQGPISEELQRGGGFEPPRMPKSYERIVTSIFDMPDPHEVFERLRTDLDMSAVRPSSATYGQIVDALDQAEKNAQTAVELIANYELAYESFLMDELAMSGSYREQAKARLEETKRLEFEANKATMGSKASGGKQITEADVAAAVASMFPDAARVLAARKAEAKGARDSVRSLADRWAERAKDLRAMVSTTRASH